MTRSMSIVALVLAALSGAMWSQRAHAAASYDNCTGFITSLPAVVSTPGTWCLKQDLSTALTSTVAIQIDSSDVTIDCNNYKVGGLAAGEGTFSYGISATNNARNITIRHCNIRGFYIGIVLSSGDPSIGGHLIEDNRLDGNIAYGIEVFANGSIVRRNLVNDTGFITLDGGGEAIYVVGSTDVLDNTVAGVTATGSYSARGIEVQQDSGSIAGNRIRGVVGGSQQVGIVAAFTSHATIRDNNLIGNGVGSGGVYCSDANGIVKDNVINAMGSAISGCTDGGGNDIAF